MDISVLGIEGAVKAALCAQPLSDEKPLFLAEVALFGWFTFFALVYGSAVLAGWLPTIIETAVGVMLVVGPLVLGLLHRRIRIEAAKGPDALYRKRIAASR